MSDDIGSDWARFQQLVDLAATADTAADRAAALRAALELIKMTPFVAAPAGRYGWVFDTRQLLSHIEVVAVDAADELAELAMAHGDPGLAEWAADRGLRVVPDQEALYRRKMQAADIADNPDGIDAAYRHAQRAAQTIDPLEEVQPETQALYEHLKRRRVGAATA